MIVEDDVTARRAMSGILKRHGFALLEVGTVAEATIGLAHQPSWVLLDLMLPDGDGSEVLQEIRRRGMKTRVCVVSGCDRGVREAALSGGAPAAPPRAV